MFYFSCPSSKAVTHAINRGGENQYPTNHAVVGKTEVKVRSCYAPYQPHAILIMYLFTRTRVPITLKSSKGMAEAIRIRILVVNHGNRTTANIHGPFTPLFPLRNGDLKRKSRSAPIHIPSCYAKKHYAKFRKRTSGRERKSKTYPFIRIIFIGRTVLPVSSRGESAGCFWVGVHGWPVLNDKVLELRARYGDICAVVLLAGDVGEGVELCC